MKKYKAIVEGVEKFFNVTPDRYDAFIAKYPDAVLVEGPENEKDSKADTEILSTVGNPGFQKDTAESADVVSEDVAQNVTGLPLDDGSLAFQNNKPLEGDDLTALEESTDIVEEDLQIYGNVLNKEGDTTFVEKPYELQLEEYTSNYTDAINAKGNYNFLAEKSAKDREFFAETMIAKPSYLKKKFNRLTNSYDLVPTEDAAKQFEKNLPSNFDAFESKKDFGEAVDIAIKKTINEDKLIKFQILQNERKSKKELVEYGKSLNNIYDFEDPKDLAKATEDWNQRAKELIIDPIVNSKYYKNTMNQISTVASEVGSAKNVEFARSKDWLLSKFDAEREIYGLGWHADFAESAVGGAVNMYKGFNQSLAAGQQVSLKETSDQIIRLEKDIASGKITEDSSTTFGGTYSHKEGYTYGAKTGSVKEKLAFLKNKLKGISGSIIEDLEAADKAGDYKELFKTANLEDGIDLTDLWRLIGESTPQMAAATAGTLTGNPVLAGLGFMTMFATEYGSNYIGAIEQGLINDGLKVTQENVMDALQKGKYANQAIAAGGAVLSAGLEQLGGSAVAKNTLKALGLSGSIAKASASLYKGEIKKMAKVLYRGGQSKLKSGVSEGFTELGQGLASQAATGLQLEGLKGITSYIDGNENYQAFTAGTAMGIFLPFGASVASQTSIELRNSARDVATRFDFGNAGKDLASVNSFFKAAENNLKQKLELNQLTEEEYLEELDNLNEAKNTGYKIPQNLSETGRKKAFDLILEKTQIENDIKGKEPELVKEDKDRILQINKELSDISAVDRVAKSSTKILKDVGEGDKEIRSVGSKEEVAKIIEDIEGDKDASISKAESYGLNVKRPGKPDLIIINEEAIFETGLGGRNTVTLEDGKAFGIKLKNNTSAHEVLHSILNEVVGDEAMIKMGDNLLSALETAYGNDLKTSVFGKRYEQYVALSKEKTKDGKPKYSKVQLAQETFTLFSEALLDKDMELIKKDKTFIESLKAIVKQVYSTVFNKPIDFDSDENLFKFIEDYNKSVTSGKGLSRRMKATIKKAAKNKPTVEANKNAEVSSSLNAGSQQELDAALQALEDAEAVLDEDFDNPQSQKAVDEAEAAFNAVVQKQANQAAGIEEESAEEVVSEEINEVAAKDFVKTKKDPSTKKRSLTPEVKSVIEKKIVKAKTETDKLVKKQKAAIDKKLKEIDALPSSEMERTPKAALKKLAKNNPVEFAKQQGIEVPKPAGLAILEKEISEDLKVPIEKFVNSVGVLFYKMQKPQVRDTVDLNTFLEVVRGDVLSLAINEFKKKTVNRQGEEIINDIEDIIFSRGGLRIRDISERLITGKEKTSSTKEIKSEEISNVKKIKPSSILAGTKNRYNRAKDKVKEFWAKNKDNEKVRTFKGLKSVIDDVIVEVFDITLSALSARSGNLNRPSMDNALKNITEPLNVVEIRNANGDVEIARVNKEEINGFIDDLNRRKLLEKSDPEYIEGYNRSKETTSILDLLTKFFPKSTVPEYFYADGDRGDKLIIEKDTGIGNKLKEALYVTKERGGLGSGNTLRDLSDVTFDDMLDVIGAYEDADGVFRFKAGVNGRSPEGLRLLELVKLTGKYITNELSRTEANLDPMTKADLAAGKSELMYSLKYVSPELLNKLTIGDVNNLKTLNVRNKTDLAKAIKKLEDELEPDYFDTLKPYIEGFKKDWEISQEAKWPDSEQRIIDTFVNLKELLPGLKIVQTKLNTNSSELDYKFELDGKEINLEAKKNLSARLGSLGIHFNETQGFYINSKHDGINGEFLGKLIAGEKDTANVFVDKAEDYYKGKFTYISFDKSGKRRFEMKAWAYAKLVKQGFLIKSTSKIKLPIEYVSQFYANKNGDVINFGDIGAFALKDNGMFDIPLLNQKNVEVDISVSWRPAYLKNGNVILTRVASPQLTTDSKKILGETDTFNFSKLKEAQAILNTNNIKTLGNETLISPSLRIKGQTNTQVIDQMIKIDKAITIANSLNVPNKGISVWDFDDTLARSKSNVLYTMPDGSNGKLTAEQFAKDGDRLMAEGAKFDFSEFSKVVNGSKGPFFEKAMARNKKFGNKNVFILTARPANSATAIHEFLKGIGLDIPLANITGLANSSPQAKANWVVGKAAEGYNDFYFADDHIGNVKAVEQALSVLDVKSKVQQARISSSLDMGKEFNKFLEGSTGIESFKKYKSDKAKLKGRFKGKLDVFIPPSAEDFLGLLYQTLNKGKLGEAQMKFYEDNLLKPYAKANSALRSARVRSIKEFDAIKKKLKIVPKDLKKSFKFEDENGNMKDSLFSKEQAIRVYIWNAQGIEMPNLSQVDLAVMVNHVNAEPELKAFADELLKLNRGMKSKAPSKNWMDGNIGIDLQANLNSVGRKKLLEVWQQNVDAIFSEENLNKLEAAYGPEYVKALKNSLRRMRTGRSAVPVTDNEAGNNLITWLNSAVGNIMFFNNRSALLQMLSATNFLNFEENNIIAAGKALMNIKQYSKDFMTLMNSDYLVDRRDGTRINVNEADIALIAKQSGIAGVISKILEKGFLPTKYADSLAIGIGGATFYRTKINALMKEGMSKAKAEAQAMQEFISVAETSQQSSDQSKISMEQAGSVGKIILAFNNTSSQYSRIIKRSVQDLYNRRGSDKANLARIVYYGGMQNLLFNFMQQAMFAAMWGGEDDEEVLDGKKAKIVNSMADGLLRGMGVKAAIFVAMKNTAIKLYERSKKDVNKDYRYYAVMGLLALSPPLSSKASKISKAASAFQYGEDKMKYGKFGLDSPKLEIGANLVSFATSLPTDRLLRKAINVSDALDASNEPWERLFMTMGWPKWTLQSKAESDLERKEDKAEIKEAKEKAEFEAMTPLEQKTKALEDLKKFQQVDSLKAYGLTDKEIRLLTKEEDRVNKILSLEGSEKKGLTPADKAEVELYDLKKKQQVDSLTKYGLTKKQIRDLKYEEDRVNEILRLRKKQKKIKDTLK